MIKVCLIGPSKFEYAFREQALLETLRGNITFSLNFNLGRDHVPPGAVSLMPAGEDFDTWMKRTIDEAYLRKIELADEVLVINVGGYIGESTKAEIVHAVNWAKPVRWLEEPDHGESAEWLDQMKWKLSS